MSDEHCHGESSYRAVASTYGPTSGAGDVPAMFPEGWGMPGETRSQTIYGNVVEARWLPLFIPPGCDGHIGAMDPVTGQLLPEVIFYANEPAVRTQLDPLGAAHASSEVDDARWNRAIELATEAASYPGSVYVRSVE